MVNGVTAKEAPCIKIYSKQPAQTYSTAGCLLVSVIDIQILFPFKDNMYSNILQTLWLANIARTKFIILRKLLFSPSSTLQECFFSIFNSSAPYPHLPLNIFSERASHEIIIMDTRSRGQNEAIS